VVGGKTAEKAAFKRAAQQGIRIILHTSLEDIVARITGERKTIYKIFKEALAKEVIA
jgi:hypothetical protein